MLNFLNYLMFRLEIWRFNRNLKKTELDEYLAHRRAQEQ